VADAALGISGGLYECAIAAGVESMSTGYVRPLSSVRFSVESLVITDRWRSNSVRAPTLPNPKAEGNALLSR
jgi:acetyl-CoA acetyltransferase